MRFSHSLVKICAAIIVALGASVMPSFAAPQAHAGADFAVATPQVQPISNQMSPKLTSQERTYLSNVLRSTRLVDPVLKNLSYRDIDIAVYDEKTNTIVYNREDLRSSLSSARHSFARSTVVGAQGITHPAIAPPAAPGTGPYRRIYTAPNNSSGLFAAEIAYVTNVCSAGNVVNKNLPDKSPLKDVGEIYMGGLSAVVGGIVYQVDAGLQYDKDIKLHDPSGQNSLDDYSLFFNGGWPGGAYVGTLIDPDAKVAISGNYGHVHAATI